MKISIRTAVALAIVGSAAVPIAAIAQNSAISIPSVIVTVENSAPVRGAFQTPIWVAAHDGSFDLYDRNIPLGSVGLVSQLSMESIAEDGNTGPITEEFGLAVPLSPQATLQDPAGGPLAPGSSSSTTFNVDPATDRFFSYASMVIPSNDAFIANGNPEAHPLFNERGRFIGRNFVVAGTEVLDAGTEINDEVAGNTAFLNQAGPNIGATEDGNLVLHEGFETGLSYPDGVLNHPVFGNSNFLSDNYRAASFRFRYVDLGRTTRFTGGLNPRNEVTGEAVDSRGRGQAFALSRQGSQISIRILTSRLTGQATMVHLHNAADGVNGPVVVNLTDSIRRNRISQVITAEDVVGPLAEGEDPFLALLNEMAAGNIYVNVHTEANPGGEIRGQLRLR